MSPFGKESQGHGGDSRHGATPTVIARETRFAGELSGSAGVRVEGHVKGTVVLKAPLDIAAGATVEAEVQATSVRVAGTVIGNVAVTELAELLAGAVVKGDITAPALHVVEGARLEGRVHMQTERGATAATASAAAPPKAP
jgi:cytoskeletal protein CcmA (bactofilin family)